MKPAARLTDLAVCPVVTPAGAHTTTTFVAGSPNVFSGGIMLLRVGDQGVCKDGTPALIVQGSATVFVNGLPAARLGDQTAHGGIIVLGDLTVLIGG